MQRLMLLALVLMLSTALASPASASYRRVHPTALPAAPAPTERVVVRFRARETLDGTYRAEVKDCVARRSPALRAPRSGRVARLKLLPPRDGWCAGSHRATVYFKQTVRCAPGVNCGDSAEVAVGSTTFTPEADPPGQSPG
jgi:hypothetical protein